MVQGIAVVLRVIAQLMEKKKTQRSLGAIINEYIKKRGLEGAEYAMD